MTERKRSKHVGFAAQREFCRNNKHTYMEKIAGDSVLMCNYPFPDPYHKKGVCKANTCTDMREIPEEVTQADEDLSKEVVEDDKVEVPGDEEKTPEEVKSGNDTMPCPSNE